jgi:hypothetical protein
LSQEQVPSLLIQHLPNRLRFTLQQKIAWAAQRLCNGEVIRKERKIRGEGKGEGAEEKGQAGLFRRKGISSGCNVEQDKIKKAIFFFRCRILLPIPFIIDEMSTFHTDTEERLRERR